MLTLATSLSLLLTIVAVALLSFWLLLTLGDVALISEHPLQRLAPVILNLDMLPSLLLTLIPSPSFMLTLGSVAPLYF